MNYEQIALVDLNSGLCRLHMGRPKDAPIGYAVEPTMRWLSDIRAQVEHVIVCLDGPPYFRKTLYPEYKERRAAPDPELNQVKRDVRARLDLDGYNVAQVSSFEADDLLATLAAHPDLSMCSDVRLYTADKDGAQCCDADGRVSMYVWNGKTQKTERCGFAWVEKKFGVQPKDMALFQALMGDTSDCYPGIKSWGEKTAAKAIKLHGTLERMRLAFAAQDADCTSNLKETPAVVRAFLEHHGEVDLYLELATLRTNVPLDVPALLAKKTAQPLPSKTAPVPEPELSDADDSGFPFDIDDEFADLKRVETLVDWNGTTVLPQDEERRAANKATIDAAPKLAGGHEKLPPLPASLAEYKALPEKLSCNYHADCAAADAKMAAANADGGPLPATAHHVSKDNFDKAKAQYPDLDPEKTAERKRIAREAMDRALAMGAQKAEEQCKVVPPKDAGQTQVSSPSAVTQGKASGGAASGSKTEQEVTVASSESSVVPATQGPKKERTEALATVAAPSWSLSAQPNTMREIVWLADHLYSQRALLEYAEAGGAAGVVLTIARGREMGLGVAASLDAFHIITVRGKTRPYPKAHFLQALAERDHNCEWIMVTSSDDKQATLSTLHKKAGRLDVQFTIERARKAGYLEGGNKHNWNTQPQNMLEARVKSWGSRLWYPGATFGLPSVEEMQDEQ